MIHIFRFTGERQTVTQAQAEPVGIKRALAVLAAQNSMPKPEVLWSGAALDNAGDKVLFAAIGEGAYAYDDTATTPAGRLVRLPL